MNRKRIQLTLFVDEKYSGTIEKIRERFNPEQYALIKSHVTLCREDELADIRSVMENVRTLDCGPLTIGFGEPVRFSGGKGVLIPPQGHSPTFQQLRANVLRRVTDHPRISEPHITLMHPRNACCTDEIFERIKACTFPGSIVFDKISLIGQEPGQTWKILEEFYLRPS